MKPKSILFTTVFFAFIFTAFASDKILHIEIQSTKTNKFDPDTYLAFATDNTIESASLSSIKQQEGGESNLFKNSYNLLTRDHRHAIIIYINNKTNIQPDQVFLLTIPPKLKPTAWTNWQHANYVEADAASNFNDGYTPPDRSTNIPPNSFELRYKIE